MTDTEIIKAKKLLKKLEDAYNAYYDKTRGMPYDLDTTIRETAILLEHSIDELNRLKAELEKHTPNKKHTEEKAMDYKFAGELAYKNGYKQGAKDFAKELESRCIKGGIYPAFVGAKVKEILREMTEGKRE